MKLKNFRLLASTCLITLFLTLPTYGYHVILDPGHGGTDQGATQGEIKEAQITLKVSNLLEKLLQEDPRFQVSLTRTTDVFIPLSERARFASQKKGDIFLSIHVNSSEDKRAKGGEIYFQNQLPPDEESMFLASLENKGHVAEAEGQRYLPKYPMPAENLKPDVQNIIEDLYRNSRLFLSAELAKTLFKTWKGSRKSRKNTIHQAPFYVVSNVTIPSTLVELGFLSNLKEAKRLNKSAYQKKMALGLYEGLVKFKEVMDKSTKSHLN